MTHSLLKKILSENAGIVIGEGHTDRSSYTFLIDHMNTLKDAGVKSIGLEGFHQDKEHLFQEYFLNEKLTPEFETELVHHELHKALGDLPGHTLEEYYRYAFEGKHFSHHQRYLRGEIPADAITRQVDALLEHTRRQDYTILSLMKAARNAGITIVPIDHTTPEKLTNEYIRTGRLSAFNEGVTGLVNRKMAVNGKYVLVTGARHIVTTDGIQGISEQLKIPSIAIHSLTAAEGAQAPDAVIECSNTRGVKTRYAPANLEVDYIISYPKKTIGTPERILPVPSKSWSAKPLLVGGAIAAILAGIGYCVYQSKKANNDAPATQLAANSNRILDTTVSNFKTAKTGTAIA